jgi:hypothetical protein
MADHRTIWARLRGMAREHWPHEELHKPVANEIDDDNFADLPDDVEAEEAAAEQRALLAAFETKGRVKTARQFILAERRAAAARVAVA